MDGGLKPSKTRVVRCIKGGDEYLVTIEEMNTEDFLIQNFHPLRRLKNVGRKSSFYDFKCEDPFVRFGWLRLP